MDAEDLLEVAQWDMESLEYDIAELKAELEEVKLDAYRYKFVRSTCATTTEQIAGYDKSVDEHIRRRNEGLN